MTHAGWLAAATFVLTTGAGAFFTGAILNASGATWGGPLRRVHEAVASALPVGALAFVVLARDLHVRDFVALAIVVVLEEWLRVSRSRAVASASLPIASFALALFANDAICPRAWSYDSFGLYVLVMSFGGGFGVTTLVATTMHERLALDRDHAAALGKLSLVACTVWAYVAFCTYLIVWIADLPSEVGFFLERQRGAWNAVLVGIVVARFAIPFLFLVPHAPKRHFWSLGALAALVVLAHAVECVWLVAPGAAPEHAPVVLASIGLVALAVVAALVRFKREHALHEAS
ncbi:MAG TPA: hypothetical protein VH054_21950 [Polyangiaceae bacterium]|jgi:hypothetical protein|nr:hypothetical protein [Polyangiaceae bacterium]